MSFNKLTLAAVLMGATAMGAQAADLRIALQSDADVLVAGMVVKTIPPPLRQISYLKSFMLNPPSSILLLSWLSGASKL